MTAKDVLKELASLGNEKTKAMLMKNHCVKEPCFGVKIGDMKPLQKRIKVDYQLALDLYDSGNYDAMYLAGLVADDMKMTKRDLQRWASKAYGGSLPGYTVAGVAAQSRYGWDMGLKWIESPKGHIALAGWTTLASLVSIKQDNELDLPAIKKLITRVKREIHKAADDAKNGMNQFLISVGCYISSLSEYALKTGEAIGEVEADLGNNSCKIPYAPDYIRKVEKRGTIGKKRKTAKC